MPKYAAALDQGTTSTRAIIFDRGGRIVAVSQKEHRQIYPQPGWVEHDPLEIWANSQEVLAQAFAGCDATVRDIAALGITNQRETTVVWERESGRPLHNAIVWQDTRTDKLVQELAAGGAGGGGAGGGGAAGGDRFRARTGLPLATYFSAPKARWILDHVPGARERAQAGELLFGTIDSWLIWNLTGGAAGPHPRGGLHLTDVSNASRTLLLDLQTLAWDEQIAQQIGVPVAMLPEVRSSSEIYGEVSAGPLAGVPIAGDLGDQQAATFGQACFSPGEAKNTYGTGNFLLMNTGTTPVHSSSGLLTTVGYKLGDKPAVYCLEGSVAVTGALVQWLRDNLGLIDHAAEIEALAASVQDNGGMYIVPAFSGLFAPYWRSDARGVFAGLTRYITKAHIARAALEATAYQSRELVEAMAADAGSRLQTLKVDGGMVANETLMQFQADILAVPVIRPQVIETTALGAAYAAGLATGLWAGEDELRENWSAAGRWEPQMQAATRERYFKEWKKAVTRTFDWVQ